MESPISHPDSAQRGTVAESTVVRTYSTLDEEYTAIRERAAVLDLSGSRVIEIAGDDAVDFAQKVLARDVEYLTAERCMTSLVLDEAGLVIDQVVVWGRETGMLVESSVGGGGRLLEHLQGQVGDLSVELTDRSGESTLFSLEGPYAWGVVGRLIDSELAALPFESVVDTEWDGVPILFARTGATGEYGYKVMVPRAEAQKLWDAAAAEATPAGQDALELAMLEVRQPLVHHEAGDADVLTMGANWLVDITKAEFVGRDAVQAAFEAPAGLRTVGFTSTGVPAAGTAVTVDGETVGEVVHAVHSVGLGSGLGLLRVPADLASAGLTFTVDEADATTLTSPYITPKSWSTPII
ncbi:aminomethyl transferase family protein [Pseudonocardia nematodicida]|uniref:Aminomethyl transferase family protein n=1 Tax=Pseudonocardia nematodicida TaxID=1206997 RepID=A0ABV1K8J4_9PSEU